MRSRKAAPSTADAAGEGDAGGIAARFAGRLAVVVSCEHGGRRVPDEYRALFDGAAAQSALDSHRAFDDGAADVARALAARVGAPLFVADTTRLVVDLNRSLGHPRLFSELTRGLDEDARARIVERYYRPYRDAVERAVGAAARRGPVLHVSAHTFTPVLDGVERRADVALLFDPRRAGEARFAAVWRDALRATLPAGTVVRRNYPYRGVSDGFTTWLRKRFAADAYLGLELEVNQRRVGGADWPAYVDAIAASLERALGAVAEESFAVLR
ncbi:MAG TPA: N-formylglutamate amidohydrolase [Gammaproteobacteria bacterium]